tara:strand:+ start:653 stop:1021 length:369 start_codon:yes stop_codon:yes gene_type:complete
MTSEKKKSSHESQEGSELSADQTLGLVSLSLMQKLSQRDPAFNWLTEANTESVNLKKLRDRLELTDLALKTGAPLSTSEVSSLMGAKPGKSKIERGGIIASKIARNVWKLSKSGSDHSYWRN